MRSDANDDGRMLRRQKSDDQRPSPQPEARCADSNRNSRSWLNLRIGRSLQLELADRSREGSIESTHLNRLGEVNEEARVERLCHVFLHAVARERNSDHVCCGAQFRHELVTIAVRQT